MEFTWNRSYCIMKRLSSLTGQWPYQNKNVRLRRMSVIAIAMLVMNVPQIYKFVECGRDLECICRTLPTYILVLIVLVKMCVVMQTSKIKVLTDHVFVDFGRLQNQEEYEIMKTYIASARWIVLVYSAICMTVVQIFVSVSLIPHILDVVLPLNESRPIILPIEGYYFVDERKYFYYIFFQSLVVTNIIVVGLVAFDSMFMTCVEHICGVFTIAGLRFKRLTCEDINMAKINNNDLESLYNKKMECCVNAHCAAIGFAEQLENIFSLNFGIELLLVTIVMSITLLQATTLHNIAQVLRHMTYVFAQLVHLFVFCWEGQRLIDHSLQMHEEIYNCTWYKIPARSQRLIIHVMRRSLRFKFLSAGRVFVYSLKGFTAVLQTSISYFTVLSSVN